MKKVVLLYKDLSEDWLNWRLEFGNQRRKSYEEKWLRFIYSPAIQCSPVYLYCHLNIIGSWINKQTNKQTNKPLPLSDWRGQSLFHMLVQDCSAKNRWEYCFRKREKNSPSNAASPLKKSMKPVFGDVNFYFYLEQNPGSNPLSSTLWEYLLWLT